MVAVPYRMIAVSLLSLSFPAFADDATIWGLGVGVVSTQKPYAGIDREYTPLPVLHIENRYFRLLGTTAEVKLPAWQWSETQQLNVGLIARYDGSGYTSDDADILQGMARRKGGVWAGVKVAWQNPLVNIFTDWSHDISDNSHGQRVRLGAERSWKWRGVTLTPRIVANRYDSDYVNYYYGVHSDEARAWRPAWQGDAALNTEIGLNGRWQFSTHQVLMVDVQTTLLASEIKESPLVDRSNENQFFLSYLYYF
ncbi:outer membrane protein [Kosakonia arachidis]|uniref:Outer membrane protein n=1 Tax=Kosakonia arachidis TaxID=551989 RepID=A0A1I6Z5X5_9ENTR|nr:MipA/OmpV family protein [Kosakonia arachidis]SFT58106.1 outer membrane protein [Kosakonia arachidis]